MTIWSNVKNMTEEEGRREGDQLRFGVVIHIREGKTKCTKVDQENLSNTIRCLSKASTDVQDCLNIPIIPKKINNCHEVTSNMSKFDPHKCNQ